MTNSEPTTDSGENRPPPMSLGGRLMNVFVAPSEVFDEVKSSPPMAANWITPLVLSVILGIVYSMVVFSQPRILQQMKEAPEQRIEKMVNQGKITRQMADQQIATMDKLMSPELFKVVGILGSVFGQPAMLFLLTLIFWLIGTFAFHGQFEYMKAVEAVGLSAMIMVPGAVVAMLLAVIYGNLAMSPGPVLLISQFDPNNALHVFLSTINIIYVWYFAVIAIALARFSGTTFIKAALWIFGLWGALIACRVGMVLIFGGK